jgi:prolyl-tRNA synthetase
MRVSKLFGETLRDVPSGVDLPGQQLLHRAGYVRQLAAGIFSYLPLAQRSLRKIEQILREEMDAIGGQEINMPVVQPSEPWQQSGRWEAVDETLVRFKDRRGRDMLLAMTHEEVVAILASSDVRSYRQLPMLVYQLQMKFRDEARARGGLIRVREFVMKDSYSLDTDEIGLERQYIANHDAYFRIFARVGLPVIAVGSDVGMMGGKIAHEFMYVSAVGEDTLVLCTSCDYAANREIATYRPESADGGAQRPTEKVHTPGTKTIAELGRFLKIEASQTIKMVFFVAGSGEEKATTVVACALRGDIECNPTKLQNMLGVDVLRPATPDEIEAVGAVPGYASPIGIRRDSVVVVLDRLIAEAVNLVAGANEEDYHLLNVCPSRDFEPDHVGDIAMAYEGAACERCGEPLRLVRGVEVGNIFQLGTRYSVPLGASYTDEAGEQHPIVMGSYGIGVGRLLGCIAEEHRDEHGLRLPITVAPYEVALVSLPNKKGPPTVAETADKVYESLIGAGVETLYDDRDASPGLKFADADLRGIPLRLTVSQRSLKAGGVELKGRNEGDVRIVPLGDAVQAIEEQIRSLHADIEQGARKSTRWLKEHE